MNKLESEDFITYCTLKPEYKHLTLMEIRAYRTCLEEISLPCDLAPDRVKECFNE